MMEAHPHELTREVPDRLPPEELRALSELDDGRAALVIAGQWVGILAALAIGILVPSWWVWALLVPWIGARQSAMTVIVHDAVHYRLFRNRFLNDTVANVLCGWPVFVSVESFRIYHGDHHRFLNAAGDGNRFLWSTHDAEGVQRPEWRYPATRAQLAWRLLLRSAGPTGLWWMVRGLLATFRLQAPPLAKVAKLSFYALGAAALTGWHLWPTFFWYWAFPFCTWQIFIQYVRLICEHSAVPSAPGEYGATRTTIPGLFGSLFVIPLNIGYHVEHHWYPSVPQYRLPELHAALMRRPGFAANAVVRRSLLTSLREVVRD
jgi:fatty acid desaturase